MKKVNVLQLITGLGMGGAEKSVLNLSINLNKNFYNNYVIGLSKRDELLNEFLENNVNTVLLRKTNSLKDLFVIVKYVNRFIKEKNIQIIHAHMTHSIIIASILKILNPNIKIVFTSHSFNMGSKIREIIIWLLKPFRNIDIIFSKNMFKFFYKKNYRIIPNGIDISKYELNINKNKKFTFIAVGRLEKMKNHKLLIEIANKLKNKYEFEIWIVGEGYLREELENLIYKYDLKDHVKLLGLRNDIPRLLNQSHCFVMPSLWEGFPISILEAGASGIPIISTPVGSIPSLINNKNGYLAEIKEFEIKMEEVLNNYQQAKEKAIRLKEKTINEYSIQNIVKKHEILYKELI